MIYGMTGTTNEDSQDFGRRTEGPAAVGDVC
jgi:hypothetical protein